MKPINFNIYSRNPVPNNPEFNQISSSTTKKGRKSIFDEETKTAKSVRRRLYGKDESAALNRSKHLTLEQRQKLARDNILDMLMDPTIIDTRKITDILCDWAVEDLGVERSVSNRIFSNALVTTESVPSKSLFRIRVKI